MRDKQFDEHLDLTDTIHMSGYGLLWEDCTDIAHQIQEQGYRKKSEVAREIFEEIEKILDLDKITDGLHFEAYWGADVAFGRVENKIAELKKKYESEGDK